MGTGVGSTWACPKSYKARAFCWSLLTLGHHCLFPFPDVDARTRSSETQHVPAMGVVKSLGSSRPTQCSLTLVG